MSETNQLLLFQIVAVILPMIPAVVLFKFLPASGVVQGPLKGLQVKFGGAFAGYLIVFAFMWEGRPRDLHHYHTWVIEGSVQLEHAPDEAEPSLRDVVSRIVPPRFEVENGGVFAFEIPVTEGEDGEPQYPDLQINLRDYSGVTVHLGERNGQRSSYGSLPVALHVDPRKRKIQVTTPIVLRSAKLQPPYLAQTPQPQVTETARNQ